MCSSTGLAEGVASARGEPIADYILNKEISSRRGRVREFLLFMAFGLGTQWMVGDALGQVWNVGVCFSPARTHIV